MLLLQGERQIQTRQTSESAGDGERHEESSNGPSTQTEGKGPKSQSFGWRQHCESQKGLAGREAWPSQGDGMQSLQR